jgi:hypothetical protein
MSTVIAILSEYTPREPQMSAVGSCDLITTAGTKYRSLMMTPEERDEVGFTILMGGWLRILQIMQERLDRPVKSGDKPTLGDIEAFRRAKPVTEGEIKTAYGHPAWAIRAERVINDCRAIMAST